MRGALKVFAAKGFDATTNKEIAREAGIASPGLIYHYFQDKASLLRAVIETHIAHSPSTVSVKALELEALLQLSVEEGLRLSVRRFLNEISDPNFVAFIRVLIGEAMRRPECARILSEVMVDRMFNTMTAFFHHHVAQGNIRPVDPAVTTVRFAGSHLSLLIMREVLQIPAVCQLDNATLETQLVEDFLRGILP